MLITYVLNINFLTFHLFSKAILSEIDCLLKLNILSLSTIVF